MRRREVNHKETDRAPLEKKLTIGLQNGFSLPPHHPAPPRSSSKCLEVRSLGFGRDARRLADFRPQRYADDGRLTRDRNQLHHHGPTHEHQSPATPPTEASRSWLVVLLVMLTIAAGVGWLIGVTTR
jgi:hypothetical protein